MPRRKVFLTNNALQRMRERRAKRARSKPPTSAAKGAGRSTTMTCGAAPEVSASSVSDELPRTVSTAGRILRALDLTANQVADRIGVHVSYVEEMLKGTSGKSPVASGHPAWVALNAYVSDRLAVLMGVREELQGKLELDKKRVLARVERSLR